MSDVKKWIIWSNSISVFVSLQSPSHK